MTIRWLPRGGPAVVMVLVVTATSGAIAYSHYAQVRDKEVMKAGVERDKERLRTMRAAATAAADASKQKQQQEPPPPP